MTIVEAMSAGSIPLAFRGGGPCETIVHAASGYLWTRPDELLKHTRYLIQNPLLRRAMSDQAIQRGPRFDRSQYLQRMDVIVSRFSAA
jgi:glycosyltransferase involved in cell wall biosynthesis